MLFVLFSNIEAAKVGWIWLKPVLHYQSVGNQDVYYLQMFTVCLVLVPIGELSNTIQMSNHPTHPSGKIIMESLNVDPLIYFGHLLLIMFDSRLLCSDKRWITPSV